jgi:hypothetical protein
MTSTNGVWAQAKPAQFETDVQNDDENAYFESVSCATPGNCTAVGGFKNSVGSIEAFTMTSTNGDWGFAQPAQFESGTEFVNPFSEFKSVSCALPGECTAVGLFLNSVGSIEAFTMSSTNDTPPTPPQTTTTSTTSVPSPTTTVTPTTTGTPPQPRIVVEQNTLQSAAATIAESTSTTTTISEDVSVTTLAPELQTPSESGSIGWWLLGGSFAISLWWIILARRRREDSPIAEGSED